jgi:hypothetical protein
MLRKSALGLFAIAAVVTIAVGFRDDAKTAPQTVAKTDVQDSIPGNGNGKSLKPSNPLPVTQVVLFNSGVGFFQRSGEIDGEARVDLQFPASDINDLIKSLVVEDSKGKTLPLHYDSQEPIEKTLKSFALDLSTNPSLGQILNQARGEKVEITLNSNVNTGLPGNLNGVIVGMETAHRLPSSTSTATAEMEFLNLKCTEGIRSVQLTQIQRIRFLNQTLENEFARALDVVAAAHDSLKKSVRLGFKGDGKREVKVGYVVENPIWKTSYRIVMGADHKPKLLGWANIENTSDEDWNNVKLTLVSSRPISFQMDLYPPLFIPRPIVEPALFATLRPQAYQGPLANFNNPGFGQQGGIGFGGMGGMANPGNTANPNLAPGQPGVGQFFQGNRGGQVNLGGQFGFQGGQFGNNDLQNFNRYQNSIQPQQQARLTYEELQNRKNGDNNKAQNDNGRAQQQKIQQQAKQLGSVLTGVDQELIEAALTAEELGNPARYAIEERVSLPRQQSAMIPILEQAIDASRVSIYNERVHPKNPLLGMRMKNNSKQSLMSGPISVYDDSHYVGDARMADLQPGEERFLSYAIDTGTEVKPFDVVVPGPSMTVKVENGLLTVQYKLRKTRTYVMRNRSPETRKVVLEQPIVDGWAFAEAHKLTSIKDKNDKETWKSGDNEKPLERTRDLYRFMVEVKPGEVVKYEVSEELPRIDPFQSTKHTDWTGFATTLGLDVWTDNQRKPEDTFTVQFIGEPVRDVPARAVQVQNVATTWAPTAGEQLRVIHKDRRATTYFIRNRADVDRTIYLEHVVARERKLLDDIKPEADNAQRYCIKLALAKGATVQQQVTEELKDSRAETFPLLTVEGTPPPRPGTNDLPQQRYVTALGFEMWFVKKTLPEELMSAKFVKGDVLTTSKQQEAVTYHLRNLSDVERTFELDHQVRPHWAFVGKDKPLDGAGIKHRFTLKSKTNQIVKQEVSEERIVPKRELIDNMGEDRLKELTMSPVPSAAVKAQLVKGYGLRDALYQTASALKEMRAQVKEINEEQARLRVNLEKLPTGSDLHKRYLGKLDKEESAIEKVQAQIVEKVALEKKQKKDYEDFIEKLNVE